MRKWSCSSTFSVVKVMDIPSAMAARTWVKSGLIILGFYYTIANPMPRRLFPELVAIAVFRIIIVHNDRGFVNVQNVALIDHHSLDEDAHPVPSFNEFGLGIVLLDSGIADFALVHEIKVAGEHSLLHILDARGHILANEVGNAGVVIKGSIHSQRF
jgi:hypothetical protein